MHETNSFHYQVNDDLAPNERKSGTCGTLMMCTSYCSVMLCAIATLVAAILVTVVMVDENLCKQYSDDELLSVVSGEILVHDWLITSQRD